MGASSSLFGVIGCIIVITGKTWSANESPCRSLLSVLVTLIINLCIGLLPLVDNFAHLGGLFSGACLSLVLFGVITVKEPKKNVGLSDYDEGKLYDYNWIKLL